MTPQQLLDSLGLIFPSLLTEWGIDNPYLKDDGSFAFHAVMMEFTTLFGREAPTANEKQFKATAKLVNEAMEAGGELENAVSTCFLEHLHQIKAVKFLKPYLGQRAKGELRA